MAAVPTFVVFGLGAIAVIGVVGWGLYSLITWIF